MFRQCNFLKSADGMLFGRSLLRPPKLGSLELHFRSFDWRFPAVLLSETASVPEAYHALKDMLKSVTIDVDEMREVIFRVNWPEDSTVVRGLRVNRITTWSTIQYGSALVQITGQSISAASRSPEKFAVRLEIDHNTDHENKEPFDREMLIPIYNELIIKAAENAASGERP